MPFGKIHPGDFRLDDDEEVEDGVTEYACTFNIFANQYINGKKWCQYTKCKQINLLTRKMQSYVKKYDIDIDYNRWAFEQCPETHQYHIHFVCIDRWSNMEKMSEWINTVNRPACLKTYITFLAKPLFYDEGWQEYLKKNQDIEE